ncbi:hypothetical protein HDU97_000455 [Phlyctochytrium planicorne]|nr:hypothetical protein HDU97_000455 [Phlyctochytrium planicorne]
MEECGVNVVVRIRPFNWKEIQNNDLHHWEVQGNEIRPASHDSKSASSSFAFDYVFGQKSTNAELYNQAARPIVESCMQGLNGTIFAYGQTSSGKTHTMQGTTEEPGLMILAINELFHSIIKTPEREFLLKVSYLEIYNEVIRDLLQPGNENLKIHEDNLRGVFVGGITERMATSPNDVFALLKKGEELRKIGDTAANERSSRSHTILRVVIESRSRKGSETNADFQSVRVASLVELFPERGLTITKNLVDLAGSERVRYTNAEGIRLKEGGHINKSLLALSNVIGKLSEGGDKILQPSLGGNARTLIICTITPSHRFMEESLSTLKFASRAKAIRNKPQINEIVSDETLIKRYKKEIESLKFQLQMVQQKSKEEQKSSTAKLSNSFDPERVDDIKRKLLEFEQNELPKTWFSGSKAIESPVESPAMSPVRDIGNESTELYLDDKLEYSDEVKNNWIQQTLKTRDIVRGFLFSLGSMKQMQNEIKDTVYKTFISSREERIAHLTGLHQANQSLKSVEAELSILEESLAEAKEALFLESESSKRSKAELEHLKDKFENLAKEAEKRLEAESSRYENEMDNLQSIYMNVLSHLRLITNNLQKTGEDKQILSRENVLKVLEALTNQNWEGFEDLLVKSFDCDESNVKRVAEMKAFAQISEERTKMSNDLGNLADRFVVLSNEKNSQERLLRQFQTENETLCAKIQNLEETIKSGRKDLHSTELKLKYERQKHADMEARIGSLELESERLGQEFRQSEDKRARQAQEITQLQKNSSSHLKGYESHIEQLEEEILNFQKEKSKSKLDLDRLSERVSACEAEKQGLIRELSRLQESLKNTGDEGRLLHHDYMRQMEEELEMLRNTIMQLEEQVQLNVTDTGFDDRKTLLSEVEDKRILAEQEKEALEQRYAALAKEKLAVEMEANRLKKETILLRKKLALQSDHGASRLAEYMGQMKGNLRLLVRSPRKTNRQQFAEGCAPSDVDGPYVESLQLQIKELMSENEKLRKDKDMLLMVSMNETEKSSRAEAEHMKLANEYLDLQAKICENNMDVDSSSTLAFSITGQEDKIEEKDPNSLKQGFDLMIRSPIKADPETQDKENHMNPFIEVPIAKSAQGPDTSFTKSVRQRKLAPRKVKANQPSECKQQ